MNDEIKGILDKCKRQIKNDLDYRVSPYQQKQLLDYITNLQQENKELKKNKLTPDELANLLNQELIKQRDDYKSRVEKAVEYIKINFVEDIITVKTLLNILNGRSDE